MKLSVSRISISVESYAEKTAENDRNCSVGEKRIVSKVSNVSTFTFLKHKLKTSMKSVSKFHVPMSYAF